MAIDTRVMGIPSLNIPLPNPEKDLLEADTNECSNDVCEVANRQGLLCWFLYLVVALY